MKSLIQFADNLLRRYTPDPFAIAIILTVFTWGLAVALTDHSPTEAILAWGGGFWNLAEFTLKMAMILLGGFVVATSPAVNRLLLKLIQRVSTPAQAVLFCTLAAIAASWINWGFGLVVGGVVALEVSRRVPAAPFRVLVASSYSGFLVWHAGLSGSIPLALNTESDKITTNVVGQTIPLAETMFSRVNLIALGCMVVLLPLLNWLMLRLVGPVDDPAEIEVPSAPAADADGPVSGSRLEKSPALPWLLGGMGIFYFVATIQGGHFRLNLDSVMFIFFMSGLLLHGNATAFTKSVNEAVPKIAPILIQYPLYAGIMALLIQTGLADQMSRFFVSVSSKDTLPLMTFYSAGLVNLFVPSGGGQWAVQAPVVLPAVEQLGADLNKTVMAVAWGDAWTNMLQPFWAVPLLTIAGLKIRDIIGLLLMVFLASGLVLSLVFLLV